MSKKNPYWGTTLDKFLKEQGIREVAKTKAVTHVVAWQLDEAMKRKGMTKADLARRMHTSRAQTDRILDGRANVTIETLQRPRRWSGASCGLSWSEHERRRHPETPHTVRA